MGCRFSWRTRRTVHIPSNCLRSVRSCHVRKYPTSGNKNKRWLTSLKRFSYTFSILLSVLYLQQQEPETVDSEKIATQPAITSGRNSVDDVERVIAQNLHAPSILYRDVTASRTPSLTGRVDLETSIPPSFSPPVTTTSNGGSYPPSAPILPRWSHMSTASSSNSRASSATSSYSHSVSTWPSSAIGSDIEAGAGNPDSMFSRLSAHTHPVSDCSEFPSSRWSMSANSPREANVVVATDGESPGADPPAYSSRPGSLYQEPMKYEAGLPLAGSPSSS